MSKYSSEDLEMVLPAASPDETAEKNTPETDMDMADVDTDIDLDSAPAAAVGKAAMGASSAFFGVFLGLLAAGDSLPAWCCDDQGCVRTTESTMIVAIITIFSRTNNTIIIVVN